MDFVKMKDHIAEINKLNAEITSIQEILKRLLLKRSDGTNPYGGVYYYDCNGNAVELPKSMKQEFQGIFQLRLEAYISEIEDKVKAKIIAMAKECLDSDPGTSKE